MSATKANSLVGMHTPGPWEVNLEGPFILGGDTTSVEAVADGMVSRAICEVMLDTDGYPNKKGWLEDAANARLLTAAPDLLAAGKLMLAFYDDLAKSNPGFMGKLCLTNYAQWNEALLQLPAAIAKAEGRA